MNPDDSAPRRSLCLIPAKGGSTRLRRKNIAELGSKPLIAWAIESARASAAFDRIVVSTEDEEIAGVARKWGAETPFLRPESLARDPAGVVEVALHALDALEQAGDRFALLTILLPTCPFRTAEDIRAAHRLFFERDGRFLMSVGPYDHTPFAALKIDEEGLITPYFAEFVGRKSQEMPPAWRANGAIHVLSVPAFREARSYYAAPLLAYPMPRERSVDIDSAEDLAYAAFLLQQG